MPRGLNHVLRALVFAAGLALSSVASSAPAVRVWISGCAPPAPPILACNANIPIYRIGQPVHLWVGAVDSTGLFRATGYTGTVTLTSSDPGAILLSPYTFTLADNSAIEVTVTFNTPGSPGFLPGTTLQTITATDTASGLVPSSASFSLISGSPGPAPPASIPSLSETAMLVLIALLALSGLRRVQHRREKSSS